MAGTCIYSIIHNCSDNFPFQMKYLSQKILFLYHWYILIRNFNFFLQVSPELYGDNYPRFFTYWTVSVMKLFSCFSTHNEQVHRGLYTIYKVRNRSTDTSLKQTDAYQATGCYNLLCSGFVQINNKIAIGAAISPRSSYHGRQFDIGIMIWKVRLR